MAAERIGDQVGLWMEYIDGRTLHQLVAEDRRHFPAREVAAIGQALCGAVAAVHAAGLLHRDIKAQNVMMARDGRVALMDFGAGRDRSATSDADLTGTPLYLAPEVLTGARSPSVQADIYGTGVLLFFLLTGTYPVTGTDIASVRSAHEHGERRSLKDLAPSVPRWLERVVERAIDPDPARRYASAEELSADLNRAPTRWKAIAAGVVSAALMLTVLITTGRWSAPRQPTNPRSYEDYLRARALLVREGINGPQQALKLFERIIASDREYAPAHAGLPLAYAYMSMTPYQGLPFEKAHPLMRAASLVALRLDPKLAEAHLARGWVHAREFEWAEAERAFRRAIALNHELTLSYTSFSYAMLRPLGRETEAEQLLREAEHVDPLAEHVRFELGRVLVAANRPADAIAILMPLRLTDSELPVDLYLGRALLLSGRIEEALPLLERRRERLIDPAGGPHPWVAWAYVKLGRRAEAEELAHVNDRLPLRRAVINGALGNTDRMFSGFEEMLERGALVI
jgi:tetratricopeptide (TPR) repeat protein